MKTSKILLSGVAAIAAGFAFAIPGIVPTPVDPEIPISAPEVKLEQMPWEKYTIEHPVQLEDVPNVYTEQTYLAIINSDNEVSYLDANGKAAEDYTKAILLNLTTNKTRDKFTMSTTAKTPMYLSYTKTELRLTDHNHVKNPIDGTFCCGATAEQMDSEKETQYIVSFGSAKDTEGKYITFSGDYSSNYSLKYDDKTISTSVYEGNKYTTGDDAKKGKFLFNEDAEKCIGFITKTQVDYVALCDKAINEHYFDKYQDHSVNPYYEDLMAQTQKPTSATTDFRTYLKTLKELMAKNENAQKVLAAQDAAKEELAQIMYRGLDYSALYTYVYTADCDTDAAEFEAKVAELKKAQADAESHFSFEMTDSTYNKQKFTVTILSKDYEGLNVYNDGTDAANFNAPIYKTKSIEDECEDGCKTNTYIFVVTRGDKTFGEGIYTANINARVDLAHVGTPDPVAVLPLKGYDQQIRWTVGSTLFNTDYDLVDGLLFFRPGTKSLYFSTVGYDPRLTGCKPKAVLTMDAGLKDFAISEPEFVETVGEFTYWKVDVSYLPTNNIDYKAVNLDNTFVTVYLPYLELKEIEWPKTAGMPVKGCTFDVIASESPVNFPYYGSMGLKEAKEIALSYEKFSGYLLYDQIYVASDSPEFDAVFTDVLPMNAPHYNYFQGKGTQNITITAAPRDIWGVTEANICVYGVRHGKVLDKIVEIPVNTTYPYLNYGPNHEDNTGVGKNFDIATETLTLGGDVKENYMDEVEIVIENLANYYDINDLKVQTNNDQFQVTQVSRFVPSENKCYITLNVKYLPCEAHEKVTGKLYVQIAGVVTEVLSINLVAEAGDEATVAAVKGSSAGINAVAADKANAVRYNVAGQRVNNAKGIVIENGKKYVK